jgi:hypothetical protein
VRHRKVDHEPELISWPGPRKTSAEKGNTTGALRNSAFER